MFQSSVSGLQRLFSSASSSLSPHTQRGQKQLGSVTEEAHTYDLLYPESDTLIQSQHHAYPLRHGDPASIAAAASSTDDRGGLDVQSPRDVRIVIAQDATTRSPQPRVLYDSQPPISSSQARNGSSPDSAENSRQRTDSFSGGLTGGGLRRGVGGRKSSTAPHTRQSSLSQTTSSILTSPGLPLTPVNEIGSILGNPKSRDTPARPATSDGETVQGRLAREGREETEALLECMFGASTGFPSTSSTKLHVRPAKSADTANAANEKRPASATRETAPSAAFPKRRTSLTRSTTAADLQSLSVDASQQMTRQSSPAIWITRLFFVDPKESAPTNRSSEALSPEVQSHSHGRDEPPKSGVDPPARKEKAKQLKTPMYAIAILLQMPVVRQRPSTPSTARFSSCFASSPKSWPFEGPSSFEIPSLGSNSEIDYVVAHWAVIDRALSSLEVVARCKISDALGRLDVPHLAAFGRGPVKPSGPVTKSPPKKRKQPTQWTLQLPAAALQEDSLIRDVIVATGRRIVLALKIRKVIAGQGRWGIWREEARWIDKWAGGREHNFFFFNLLTSFVGFHTEWLDALAPKGYRRRHARVCEKGRKENNAIQHRTVIVSWDKMAGRRLVFLLSAFLPGAHSNLLPEGRVQLDPHWSNSLGSQYPSPGAPNYRQLSSRRVIQHRLKEISANDTSPSCGRLVGFSRSEVTPKDDTSAEDEHRHDHSRRPSDAKSARSTALLISSDGSVTRKSSTTTTATIKPESSVPVAHFAGHPSDPTVEATRGPRPGSSESLAPLSLQQTLSRSDSNELGNASGDSQSRSGWGSLVSLWSGRRGSSTEESDPLASSEEGLGISGIPKNIRSQPSAPKLTQMVDEVAGSRAQPQVLETSKDQVLMGKSPLQGSEDTLQIPGRSLSPRKIPNKSTPQPLPLKLSIDESDGVVEVGLPPPGSFSSSFGSIASSPGGIPTTASSLNDRTSSHVRAPNPVNQHLRSESAGDVAGWLRAYHEDFTLQAVRPYTNLKEDIKRSMRTEPTPTSTTDESDTDTWTEVCSTIIADTTTFTITRLSLHRKDAYSSHHRAKALLESPTSDVSHEEQITEEPLMDMDPIFIDAVEKVLSHSGDSSRVASRAPSPIRHRASTATTEGSPAGIEIPRNKCKSMVLGALEQVAKNVSEEMVVKERSGHDGKPPVRGRGRHDIPMESTLREGVRRWFREVDALAP